MTNLELQSDEVSALQSIFDRNFRFLDSNRYELLIEFDLPSTFKIQWQNQKIPIRHLPPLCLTVEYHDDYPSISPPRFSLACFYLSPSDLVKMEQKLETYSFTQGEVCVYEWVELIKAQIGDELVLDHTTRTVDRLIDYDRKRDENEFECQVQTCSICFDELQGVSCVRLRQCGHFFCQDCLNYHVKMSLERGLFGERLSCPQTECRQALLPHEIKTVIRDEQIYQRYERVTLQHGLELMEDILWCPRCQQAVLPGQGEDNLAMCDACQYTFCKKCQGLFHSNTLCPREYEIEQLRLKREKELERMRRNAEEQTATQPSARATKKPKAPPKPVYRSLLLNQEDEERVIEEILSWERMELLNTQKCPKCHVQIEKNGGCSHMHCSRCDYHFTWQSLPERAPIPGQYLTTSASAVPEVETIKEELEKVGSKEQDAAGESTEVKLFIDNRSKMGALVLNRTRNCPGKTCQHINVRLSTDNYVRCNECGRLFCFVCGRQGIREKHFVRKCPRYSSFE